MTAKMVLVTLQAVFEAKTKKDLSGLLGILHDIETAHGGVQDVEEDQYDYHREEKVYQYWYTAGHLWPLDETFQAHLTRLVALFETYDTVEEDQIHLDAGDDDFTEMALLDVQTDLDAILDKLRAGGAVVLTQAVFVNGQRAKEKQLAGLDTRIQDAKHLTPRTKGFFRALGMVWVPDILAKSADELDQLPDFVQAKKWEVNAFLSVYDLHIGDKVTGWKPNT